MVQGLIFNLSLLIALSVLAGYVTTGRIVTVRQRVWQGLLFGSVAVVGMVTSMVLQPGIIFDGRSMVLSLCGLFFGPIPAAIAAGMALICRLIQGGNGVVMGSLVILLSSLIGVLLHYRWVLPGVHLTLGRLYGFGLLVHVVMLLMAITLPRDSVWAVLVEVSLPVLVIYPLATLLAGKILADQQERHGLFEELKQSEERYRAVVDLSTNVAIQTYAAEGTVLSWNKGSERLYGYTASEAIGRNFAELIIPPELMDRYNEEFAKSKSSLEPIPDLEVTLKRKDGSPVVVFSRNGVIRLPGRPPEFYAIDVDVTERRAAEQAQREAELSAQSTVDALTAHIAILDESGTIISVNRSWREFARQNGGISDRLAEGANYLEVCEQKEAAEDPDARAVAEGIRAVLAGERKEFAWEYPCHSPTVQRWFIARITRFGEEKALRAVVAHENITARKLAEQKVLADEERLQRQRNALIALMDLDALSYESLDQSLAQLTEVTARTMDVQRVGVWRFDEQDTVIRCVNLYELREDRHTSGQELQARDYPAYFEAIARENLVVADDALTDPNTREFGENYLRPNGITSIMDAPIHVSGVLVGVLCLEHVGGPRTWTGDEKTFAVALANLVSLAHEGWERRKIEKALRDSVKELSDVKAALDEHAIVSITDPQGTIVHANDKFCEVSKYAREELVGENHRIINSGHHPESYFREMWETISSGRIWKGEVRNRAKDGSFYWVDATIVPFLDEEGNPYQYVAVRTDITKRKQAEEETRELAARLSHYLGVSPTITYALKWTGDEMVPVWVSENVEPVLGYAPEEVLRPDWWSGHVHPEDRDRALASHLQAIESGSVTEEYRITRKDGRSIWMRDEMRRVDNGSNGDKEFVGAWTEITEHKRGEEERERLEAQLVQAQRMEAVGRLAGGVAHDFNNMLSVIIGHAELAIDEIDKSHPLHEDLTEIMTTSKRAAEITKQLLAFARRQTSAPRILNLNETIGDMLRMLRRLTTAQIELVWQPGEDLWPVKIDPAQVDQVMANLIVNASDAIKGQGTITIATRNVPEEEQTPHENETPMFHDAVELMIQDTGCGMSDEVLAHIFEPFFTTKEIGKGTGLGLATVYGILQQNRGSVNVWSRVGEGTTFRLKLPRFQEEEERHETAERRVKPADAGEETVMLVEDEQAVLALGVRFLKRLGYKVIAFSDPVEAVRKFEEAREEVDLLMTDVVMPNMSGRDVYERVRTIRPDLKCLFVSGYTADVIATHGVLSDGVHFLQKPYTVDALARKLREVLDA